MHRPHSDRERGPWAGFDIMYACSLCIDAPGHEDHIHEVSEYAERLLQVLRDPFRRGEIAWPCMANNRAPGWEAILHSLVARVLLLRTSVNPSCLSGLWPGE